jgi:hypothetical protein
MKECENPKIVGTHNQLLEPCFKDYKWMMNIFKQFPEEILIYLTPDDINNSIDNNDKTTKASPKLNELGRLGFIKEKLRFRKHTYVTKAEFKFEGKYAKELKLDNVIDIQRYTYEKLEKLLGHERSPWTVDARKASNDQEDTITGLDLLIKIKDRDLQNNLTKIFGDSKYTIEFEFHNSTKQPLGFFHHTKWQLTNEGLKAIFKPASSSSSIKS